MKSLPDLQRQLLRWYRRAARALPWRKTGDPYAIWVSEIMLQQTRVAAVLPYYERFLARFPDAETLARAPETEVLAAWSGLGYYSRARNMQLAARQILDHGGFPHDYASIRRLAGVGECTAAAIASIAFGLPHAAVDGNVLRVLSRLTGDSSDIAAAATRRRLREIAELFLDRRRPGPFNQAMMELGATICVPQQPQCHRCPIAAHCQARRRGTQNELPVKLRKVKPQLVEKTLLVIEHDGKLLLHQRGTSPMRGFWELPEAGQAPQARLGERLGAFRHSIVNHNYRVTVLRASLARAPRTFRWVAREDLASLPPSTMTLKAIRFLA